MGPPGRTRRRCGGDAEWLTLISSLLTGWVREFARVIGENAQFLTDLDAAIGDADHGINMDRGMTAVIEALDLEKQGPHPPTCPRCANRWA